MVSERGIIIIGHCRQGKVAMLQQLLKERPVLVGVDFGDMASAVASLNMSFDHAATAVKYAINSINELKKITPDKQPSKFISRSRNNFKKR